MHNNGTEQKTGAVAKVISLIPGTEASTGKGFSPYRTGLYNFSGLFLQDLYVLVSLLRLNCAH